MTDAELIREAALEAGELALTLRRRGLRVEYKTDHSPVSDADVAVDALLIERLRSARPDYGWLSEETADSPDRLDRRRVFVVDPIDGTRAYVKDKPWFAVCIAVVEDGEVTHGVVQAPALDETYEATLGGGATLNSRPISPSATTRLEGAGMLGDPALFSYKGWATPWPAMRIESRNSIAYRMCLVADGRFDAAVALRLKHDWDVAASSLIVSEAGAWVGDHQGRAYAFNQAVPAQASLVACTPALKALILDRTRPIDLTRPRTA